MNIKKEKPSKILINSLELKITQWVLPFALLKSKVFASFLLCQVVFAKEFFKMLFIET